MIEKSWVGVPAGAAGVFVLGDDIPEGGSRGCYHELTGKWQREVCGRSVSGWEANEAAEEWE